MELKHAAQLHTVREETKKDFPGVLRALKRMGWMGVQISGLQGYDPEEIAAVMRETGLGTAGMHVGLARMETEFEQVVQEARLFSTNDVVCPFLAPDLRTEQGYRLVKERLLTLAKRFSEHGLRLSYHNHAFEFETVVDGKSALEFLLDPAHESKILAEIDVYWVARGERNPVEFMRPYADRMPIIHLKDMTADERQTFAEIGTGQLDFLSILAWCERSGVEWHVVEQDQCAGDPMDSLALSLRNLKDLAARV
ncbi:MAG: sugar phosphate isomerase/epimerase family protein [Bacilli bacterium]